MKKCIVLVVIILSLKFNVFGLSLAHGLSAGNVGVMYSEDEKALIGDLITYRVIEKETRLGLTVNLFSLGYGGIREDLFTKFRDPLSLELTWDPLYELSGKFRFSVYQRVSDYISGDYPIESRTGLRVGYNFLEATDNYTGYPAFHLETGVINFQEFYFSANMDILVFTALQWGLLDVLAVF